MNQGTAHRTELRGLPRDSGGRILTGLHWYRLEDEHDHVVGYKAIRDGIESYYDISYRPKNWDGMPTVPASSRPIPHASSYAIHQPPSFMVDGA